MSSAWGHPQAEKTFSFVAGKFPQPPSWAQGLSSKTYECECGHSYPHFHYIYAGWIVWPDPPPPTFLET